MFSSFSQYLISIFIIDCLFKRIQKFLLFNMKMTVERSKRRCFLTLTFIVKYVNFLLILNKPFESASLFLSFYDCSVIEERFARTKTSLSGCSFLQGTMVAD